VTKFRFFWLSSLLFLALASPVLAEIRRIDPGEPISLSENEGLVLIGVDSSAIRTLRITEVGRLFYGTDLDDLPHRRNYHLYAFSAGRYRWDSIHSGGGRVNLDDDPEFEFQVEAGRLNYPGDLRFRWRGGQWASVYVVNHAVSAMEWLEITHPPATSLPFHFTGRYPDPFPEFYRQQRAANPEIAASSLWQVTSPGGTRPLPLAPATLWANTRIEVLGLNPGGNLLAIARHKDQGRGVLVELLDLVSGESITLIESQRRSAELMWSGDGTLIAEFGEDAGWHEVFVFRISGGSGEAHSFQRLSMPRAGTVLHVFPDQANAVLYQSYADSGDLMIHRVDITDQASIDRTSFRRDNRLNRGVENDVLWIPDHAGNLSIVGAIRNEHFVLLRRTGEAFEEVLSERSRGDFEPLALSADSNVLYGLSDAGRSQRDLVEFDLRTQQIARTAFSKPGTDTEGALLDSSGALIGVNYYQEGRLVNEYFADRNLQAGEALQALLGERSYWLYQRSADGQHWIVGVFASDMPEAIYYYDVGANKLYLVDSLYPWLDRVRFSPSRVVRATSQDGLPVEGYLTLPRGVTGRPPLVVMPHGGPMGVRDDRGFDREVQFLASLGYAVLQVNFRGSEGYGRAHREAARMNYGLGIEDDIDAVFRAALQLGLVDESKVCIMGASYGGYSALISAIRWPDRFRCAISISGPTDRVLVFSASDSGQSETGRQLLESYMGDPRDSLETMQQTSPVYRYRELKVPLLLVHGREDPRVDAEHVDRLIRLLNLAGNRPTVLIFSNEGHGIVSTGNRQAEWMGIAVFLDRHLGDGSQVTEAAPSVEPSTPVDISEHMNQGY
jgi:pimeloyl-ACP methyl ester carboxylesterase